MWFEIGPDIQSSFKQTCRRYIYFWQDLSWGYLKFNYTWLRCLAKIDWIVWLLSVSAQGNPVGGSKVGVQFYSAQKWMFKCLGAYPKSVTSWAPGSFLGVRLYNKQGVHGGFINRMMSHLTLYLSQCHFSHFIITTDYESVKMIVEFDNSL